MNQESVGVVGIAEANRGDEIRRYVRGAAAELVSRLVTIVAELDQANDGAALLGVLHQEQWEDFRCYVNHLVNEIRDLDRVISTVEDSLRNTYGYRVLQETPEGQVRARKLVDATKLYASKIAQNPGCVAQADSTGFSFEGVTQAMIGIGQLERRLTPDDFSADRLFGEAGSMADFYGVMLRIPQLARQLKEITPNGIEHQHLAGITRDWVNGKSIQEIAQTYFRADQDATRAITEACKAIYRNLTNNGTWGLSALSRLSGMDFDRLSEVQKRQINLLPAMIYHGVRSEEAVLMRMNGVPRSIAETIGETYRTASGLHPTLQSARAFLTTADIEVWNRAKPTNTPMSGEEYRSVWRVLSGGG
jgi:hypothetical protein